MKLQNKNIILTGASRGFGKYLATRLLREDASLLVVSRTLPQGSVRLDDEQSYLALEGDLLWFNTIEDVQLKASNWSHVDGLVNNAAVQGPIGPTWENVRREVWDTLVTDLMAPMDLCRAFIPGMLRQQHGKIVNLSGGGAAGPRPNYSAYATAKAGLVRFSECLAEELRGTGIDVNCVAPGAMPTGMLGPEAAPVADNAMEKAADLIIFLLSDESNGITGKLISAVWDDWRSFTKDMPADDYTLRRIVPKL